VLHLRREAARRLKHMVPAHVWALVRPYGLVPEADEASVTTRQPTSPPSRAGH